jgi:hypothetical protein
MSRVTIVKLSSSIAAPDEEKEAPKVKGAAVVVVVLR